MNKDSRKYKCTICGRKGFSSFCSGEKLFSEEANPSSLSTVRFHPQCALTQQWYKEIGPEKCIPVESHFLCPDHTPKSLMKTTDGDWVDFGVINALRQIALEQFRLSCDMMKQR